MDELVTDDAFVPCTLRSLPDDQKIIGAATATNINPSNRPRWERFAQLMEKAVGVLNARSITDFVANPQHIAIMTQKYWGSGGVKLSVSFMGFVPADLAARILLHMNAWGKFSNVVFSPTQGQGQVRIAFNPDGYWSYLGTDVLQIPANQPTMNLQGFSMRTPESEFVRVVRHETGHTLGCPHEHMRQQLVARLDVEKTVAYFQRTQGWSRQETMQQVLKPLSEASIRGTSVADQDSVMCYQLPGSITIDGQPIRGGADIDQMDAEFIAKQYPLAIQPPPPPPPVGTLPAYVEAFDAGGMRLARYGRV